MFLQLGAIASRWDAFIVCIRTSLRYMHTIYIFNPGNMTFTKDRFIQETYILQNFMISIYRICKFLIIGDAFMYIVI